MKINGQEVFPYSYHTFLYPFSYKLKDKVKLSSELFKDFVPVPAVDKETVLALKSKKTKDGNTIQEYEFDDIWNYNEYQYFFEKARKNLFNESTGQDDRRAYSLHLKKRIKYDKGTRREFWGTLDIHRSNFDYDSEKLVYEHYELKINDISISFYPEYNIGILILETEFYPKEGEKNSSFNIACKINDFGRRVFSPSVNYLVDENGIHHDSLSSTYMTASRIVINQEKFGHKKDLDFPSVDSDIKELRFEPEIELLKKLIGNEYDSIFKDVDSILDDRMFTICLIRDDVFSTKVKRNWYNILKEYPFYPYSPNLRLLVEDIYRAVFLDGVSASCQSERLLREKLTNHIYDRWIDQGTFHGVTEYSFVCVTGEKAPSIPNSVIYPFLTQYVDMAKLALLQRAEIVTIEEDAMNTVNKIGIKNSNELTENDIKQIREIWREYVFFQSEVYLPEVTFQEQGVELYSMLKKALKIEVLMERVDNEMNNLKDLSQMASERIEKESSEKIEKRLNLLTVVGFTLALFSAGQDFIANMVSIASDTVNLTVWHNMLLSFLLLGGISILMSWRLNKASDSELEKKCFIIKILNHGGFEFLIWVFVILIVILSFGFFVNHDIVNIIVDFIKVKILNVPGWGR